MNLFSPAEVAKNYINIGKGKVNTPVIKMFLLGILAGAFIGIGGIASTTASVSVEQASVAKFLSACIFPGGLTMVLLAGSELFTGNNLLVIPLLEKEITFAGMLKNWGVVYLGNFVGSFLIAAGVVYGHSPSLFGNKLAVSIISTSVGKCSMTFSDALIRGILCNFLVCIAVWISFAAKDVAGKVIGLFFPIMMFVVCGFEHSVANMYYVCAGLLAKGVPQFAEAAAEAGIDFSAVTVANMLGKNLLPVTIGNIIGGAICVGCTYWFIYLRKTDK